MITLNSANFSTLGNLKKQNRKISFGNAVDFPLPTDPPEKIDAFVKSHPVEFDTDPANPKIRKNIRIRYAAYDNAFKLKNEYNEFFMKSIDPEVSRLGSFAYYIEQEKQGKLVELPNCIMIQDPADIVGDEMIKMAKDLSDTNCEKIVYKNNQETQKELYETLKKCKANFDKTGKRSLLEVEGFENLILKEAPFSLTEWMKGVMTACAEKYKTTIIFKTKDSSKFVSETMEPHRVGLKLMLKTEPFIGSTGFKPAEKYVTDSIQQRAKEEILSKSKSADKPVIANNTNFPLPTDPPEVIEAFVKSHPVEFDTDPANPKIRKNFRIRYAAYDNAFKLKNEYNEFFMKNIHSETSKLNYFACYIEQEKQGKLVELPNCIMIQDPADIVGDEMIKMAKDLSDTNCEKIVYKNNQETQKELYETLNKCKANFDKTGKRSLLEVEGFENLILKEAPFSLTEWMKDIMNCCADEFRTTIIFKTKDSSKLVSETMEPHRVGLKLMLKTEPFIGSTEFKKAEVQVSNNIKQIPKEEKPLKPELPSKSSTLKNEIPVSENINSVPKRPSAKINKKFEDIVKEGEKQVQKSTNKKIKTFFGILLGGGGIYGAYEYYKKQKEEWIKKQHGNNINQ